MKFDRLLAIVEILKKFPKLYYHQQNEILKCIGNFDRNGLPETLAKLSSIHIANILTKICSFPSKITRNEELNEKDSFTLSRDHFKDDEYEYLNMVLNTAQHTDYFEPKFNEYHEITMQVRHLNWYKTNDETSYFTKIDVKNVLSGGYFDIFKILYTNSSSINVSKIDNDDILFTFNLNNDYSLGSLANHEIKILPKPNSTEKYYITISDTHMCKIQEQIKRIIPHTHHISIKHDKNTLFLKFVPKNINSDIFKRVDYGIWEDHCHEILSDEEKTIVEIPKKLFSSTCRDIMNRMNIRQVKAKNDEIIGNNKIFEFDNNIV